MLSREEALRQIRLGIRRVALLYHAFAQTLIDQLGRERGFEVIRKAIDAYGSHIGKEARRVAEGKGLQPVPENFESDLPTLAWETEQVTVEGEGRVRVHHCPLAKEWIELGEREIGRLYCFVDQAKMKAFNPEYEYLHLKNLLDGDPYCELVIRRAKGSKGTRPLH
jgi:predicted ArsR family transcriptional regulator